LIFGDKKGVMMINRVISKVTGILVAIGIFSLLLFSGPAQAYVTSLVIDNNVANKGETITMLASVETGNLDNPKTINYIILNLSGPDKVQCKFYPNTTIISGCNGITIEKFDGVDNGYCQSYGYGYGCKLEYKIKLNTDVFDYGNYATLLILNANGKNTITKTDSISIKVPNKVCSIRASEGKLIIENKTSMKNKINFYIPLKNAMRGEGYLTGQLNRDRFIYRFNIDKILENSIKKTSVQVTGKYKIGLFGQQKQETAIITFDRVTNVTSLTSDDIKMTGMKINFREWC
jgi:hypothetical protein